MAVNSCRGLLALYLADMYGYLSVFSQAKVAPFRCTVV